MWLERKSPCLYIAYNFEQAPVKLLGCIRLYFISLFYFMVSCIQRQQSVSNSINGQRMLFNNEKNIWTNERKSMFAFANYQRQAKQHFT